MCESSKLTFELLWQQHILLIFSSSYIQYHLARELEGNEFSEIAVVAASLLQIGSNIHSDWMRCCQCVG